MILPSLFGLMPMFDALIAFSMAASIVVSHGLTMIMRGSGTVSVATPVSGVRAP